jgi:hypothetical protein
MEDILFYTPNDTIRLQTIPSGDSFGNPPHIVISLTTTLVLLEEILRGNLFSLREELLSEDFKLTAFSAEQPIQLQLIKGPDVELPVDVNTPDEVIALFQQEEHTKQDWQYEKHWVIASLSQGDIHFRTMWDYCDWAAAAKGDDIGQIFFSGFTAFAQENGLAKEMGEAMGDEILGSDIIKMLFSSDGEGIGDSPLMEGINQIISESIDESFRPEPSFGSTEMDSFQQLVQFLIAEGWGFTRQPNVSELSIDFQGDNLRWLCYAYQSDDPPFLIFYSYYPIEIAEQDLDRVQLFLSEANFNMINGNFELDRQNLAVRYKTSLWVGQSAVPKEAFRHLLFTNVSLADVYFAALRKVLEEDADVFEVLGEV